MRLTALHFAWLPSATQQYSWRLRFQLSTKWPGSCLCTFYTRGQVPNSRQGSGRKGVLWAFQKMWYFCFQLWCGIDNRLNDHATPLFISSFSGAGSQFPPIASLIWHLQLLICWWFYLTQLDSFWMAPGLIKKVKCGSSSTQYHSVLVFVRRFVSHPRKLTGVRGFLYQSIYIVGWAAMQPRSHQG